ISSSLVAIVTAYLIVALLSIGTLIAFSLAVGVNTRYVEVEFRTFSDAYWQEYWQCSDGDTACYEAVPVECVTRQVTTSVSPTDKIWWILAMNPYVIVGDMVAGPLNTDSYSNDMFGLVSAAVRGLQIETDTTDYWTDCPTSPPYLASASPYDDLTDTVAAWWIGLGLQIVLAAGILAGAYRRLKTPTAKLARGSRVA
ncbi:MAG: hypothetical protein GX862_00145, partial [Leucobacter sp.]|nr:hypothetical protein [Leucobacter sp.]